ncbi:MAG: monovalent cation/H(+) antiporter subunit G [Ignavibacteria bacterium]|nr:monovalent cation/H(+) antiporter subunit G [Ignavibacteria bacterium]
MSDILTGSFLILGSFVILLAALGILKMPDIYLRMSASTKASTLGISIILITTGLHFGTTEIISRTILIVVFLMITAPVASHLLGKAAYLNKLPLWNTKRDDLKKL